MRYAQFIEAHERQLPAKVGREFHMPQAQPTRKVSRISRGLIASESLEEYDALVAEFISDTNARDVIERTFVADAAHLTWEIRRYRRLRAMVFSLSYRNRLQTDVERLLYDAKIEEMRKAAAANSDEPQEDADEIDAETLQEVVQRSRYIADRWNAGDEGCSEVAKLSLEIGFDESDIETLVLERCQDRIEQIDRSLAMLESRRMAAIRFLGEYRGTFARKVHAVSNRLIEHGAPNPQQIATQT
jgi:hypothetical protein